jgi:hypothetical protein
MAPSASTSLDVARPSESRARARVAHSPTPLGAFLFCALTGRGIDEWLRLSRDLRLVTLIGKALVFIAVLLLREWLFERVADSLDVDS